MVCKNCLNNQEKGNYCSNCGNPYLRIDIEANCLNNTSNVTLRNIYEEWSVLHYRRISIKTRKSYETAWKKLNLLYDVPMKYIKTKHVQSIIDYEQNKSKTTINNIKVLYSHLCKFAMMEDIINVNYSQFLLNEGKIKESYDIFNDSDIAALFHYANSNEKYSETAKITLCLIYTGFRPNELFSITVDKVDIKKEYFINGSKTEAGKNRILPISRLIIKYVREFYLMNIILKQSNLLFLSSKEKQINSDNWRKRNFYPMIKVLGFNKKDRKLKPYSARHTFASLCYRANIDDAIKIKMIGHTDVSLTHEVYTHFNLEQYKKEITKLDDMMLRQIASLNE